MSQDILYMDLPKQTRKRLAREQRGLSSRLARSLKVSTATISLVIYGKATSARVQDALNEAFAPFVEQKTNGKP